MRICMLMTACLLLAISVTAQVKEDKTALAFDNYIRTAMPLWKQPGLSVVVVKDGNIVFEKGYGVRELGKPAPYTNTTLSTCASTTKAMTAACMGMLVDEGKLHWDDRVADLLPSFKLADPFSSAAITVLDLFTHNAGLGNADMLWVAGYTREEIIHRMQSMTPAYSLRSDFIYQNLMYIVAGEVIHAVSGKTWDAFITERLFTPLGMNNTFADHSAIPASAISTVSHYPDNDSIKPIPYLYTDNIGAAGGVWSCADDMAKWLTCLLDSTRINGRRLLKPATYAALFTPQVVAPLNMYATLQLVRPHWLTYGLGWFQQDYRGQMLQFHTGSLAGLTAIAALVPDEHFGLYVYGNVDHSELRHALMYKAVDLWLHNDAGNDWSGRFYTLFSAMADSAKAREKRTLAKRVLQTHPTFPLTTYTGSFTNEHLATVQVTLKDSVLSVTMPGNISLQLAHWQYDVFRGAYNRWWFGKSWVQFIPGRDGEIKELAIDEVKYTRDR
ncbi:MAG TPA: serine hydrolase [Chitinophagaceae bacterium]|nr:serine hydrolase [Chitinophagaceae bacterium]